MDRGPAQCALPCSSAAVPLVSRVIRHIPKRGNPLPKTQGSSSTTQGHHHIAIMSSWQSYGDS